MLSADQLLARLYALRKDYADDPEDETYQGKEPDFKNPAKRRETEEQPVHSVKKAPKE